MPSATMPSTTRPAPAALGTPRRLDQATIGIVTVATTNPAITGATIPRCAEQQDQREPQAGHPQQQPGGKPQIAQPARRRKDRRQLSQLRRIELHHLRSAGRGRVERFRAGRTPVAPGPGDPHAARFVATPGTSFQPGVPAECRQDVYCSRIDSVDEMPSTARSCGSCSKSLIVLDRRGLPSSRPNQERANMAPATTVPAQRSRRRPARTRTPPPACAPQAKTPACSPAPPEADRGPLAPAHRGSSHVDVDDLDGVVAVAEPVPGRDFGLHVAGGVGRTGAEAVPARFRRRPIRTTSPATGMGLRRFRRAPVASLLRR